jgi:SnoaL-like domain
VTTTTLDLSPAAAREISLACERLSLDYAHYADSGESGAWAGLFAEDGEFHAFGQIFRGRTAIGAIFAGPKVSNSMHITSNVRVSVLAEDRAEGTAYVTAYSKPVAGPSAVESLAPSAVGIYRDTYRRTADGWRFASRAFEPFLTLKA